MTTSTTFPAGIHVPLITPFASDGSIAVDALEALAHDVLAQGATGLVALGTTAEVFALSAAEKQTVTEVCVRVARARGAHLTVGVGSNNTRTAVEAVRALKGTADAVLATVPYFIRPAEAGVVAHFAELTGGPPVLFYNIPYRTGQSLSAATLRRLAALPDVVGVKQAVGGIDADTAELMADLPEDFAVLAGDDIFVAPLLSMGAHGGILASAHLRTADFVSLAAGNASMELSHSLARLSAALFTEPNPAVTKAVLHAQGRIPTAEVRLPLLPASPEALEAALHQLSA